MKLSHTIQMGKRGTVVIPADVRRRLGLAEGTFLVTEVLPEGVLLRPARVVATEEPGWQERMMEDFNEAMADLAKNHPEEWNAELAEQAVWEGTLMDGLDADEDWDPTTRLPRHR